MLAVCFCRIVRQIRLWRSFFPDFPEHSFYFLYNFRSGRLSGYGGLTYYLHCAIMEQGGAEMCTRGGAGFCTRGVQSSSPPTIYQTYYISDLSSDKTEEGHT